VAAHQLAVGQAAADQPGVDQAEAMATAGAMVEATAMATARAMVEVTAIDRLFPIPGIHEILGIARRRSSTIWRSQRAPGHEYSAGVQTNDGDCVGGTFTNAFRPSLSGSFRGGRRAP
jgi:hypothetical protein